VRFLNSIAFPASPQTPWSTVYFTAPMQMPDLIATLIIPIFRNFSLVLDRKLCNQQIDRFYPIPGKTKNRFEVKFSRDPIKVFLDFTRKYDSYQRQIAKKQHVIVCSFTRNRQKPQIRSPNQVNQQTPIFSPQLTHCAIISPLRLWGDHGQSLLENSQICLVNATALGTEILKGLVLPGIGSFTIIGESMAEEFPSYSSFFFLKITIW
jgi:hypothetical protein